MFEKTAEADRRRELIIYICNEALVGLRLPKDTGSTDILVQSHQTTWELLAEFHNNKTRIIEMQLALKVLQNKFSVTSLNLSSNNSARSPPFPFVLFAPNFKVSTLFATFYLKSFSLVLFIWPTIATSLAFFSGFRRTPRIAYYLLSE